jgi:hypothetical protein
MASGHGIPRIERERDVEKEKASIAQYRNLLDQVNAKVHSPPTQPT